MIKAFPAIDIIDGRCVRLSRGDYATEKQYGDPLAIAKEYRDAGFEHLHLVDLDGARGTGNNLKVLEEITTRIPVSVDWGGGIRDVKMLGRVFDAGADMVSLGSVAVKNRDLVVSWGAVWGEKRFIIGCDSAKGLVSVGGWQEKTQVPVSVLISYYVGRGFSSFLCTDIDRDGMLEGPAIPFYRTLLAQFPHISLIASGGVSTIQDVKDLDAAGVPAVVVGKALLEGRFTPKELWEAMHAR